MKIKLVSQCLTLLLLVHADISLAEAEEERLVRFEWQCAASGFYGMEVFPDGTHRPFAESYPRKIVISVYTYPKTIVPNSLFMDYRVWEGTSLAQREEFSEDQVQVSYEGKDAEKHISLIAKIRQGLRLEELRASNLGTSPQALIVQKDDAEWRFTFSRTMLVTAKESRNSHIMAPEFPAPAPRAEVYFATGECAETK
jgi:hypothetical protein